MKNLHIQVQTQTEQEAYGIINQINSKDFKQFYAASKLTGTGRVKIYLNEVTKSETVDCLLQLKKLYPGIIEAKALFFDNKTNEQVCFMKLPVTNVLETEDLIKEFKLKQTIKDLQEA